MAGTLTTVSKVSHNTGDAGRRLLVRGNRLFLLTGQTGSDGAVRAFDVNTNTGEITEVPGPLLSSAWTGASGVMTTDCGLLSSFDLMDQPKTAISGVVSTVRYMLTLDLSSSSPASSVINSDFIRTTFGGSVYNHFTCRKDGLVAAKGSPEGFGEGRYLSAGNVVANTKWIDQELQSGNFSNFLMHQSQSYIHVCREIETPFTGGGVREALVYAFDGTASPSLYAIRNDNTGVGIGASLYTNTFPSQVPATPSPETNVPELEPGFQPWPGHPDYLISFFNRKTPGTTPEVQAWIGFLNVSDPLSFTFEAAVLVSGYGKWVLNRNNEVLAHTTWSDADGTYAFLRVAENGVERLLKVHVETGIPHDSWSFDPSHYPVDQSMHGEFITEAGWYGVQYRSELHILGRINGAPKKFYYPTHWSSILRAGR